MHQGVATGQFISFIFKFIVFFLHVDFNFLFMMMAIRLSFVYWHLCYFENVIVMYVFFSFILDYFSFKFESTSRCPKHSKFHEQKNPMVSRTYARELIYSLGQTC